MEKSHSLYFGKGGGGKRIFPGMGDGAAARLRADGEQPIGQESHRLPIIISFLVLVERKNKLNAAGGEGNWGEKFGHDGWPTPRSPAAASDASQTHRCREHVTRMRP